MNEVDHAKMELVAAVRGLFQAESARNTMLSPLLERALEHMKSLEPDPDAPAPNRLPVCEQMVNALDLAERGPAANVAEALRVIEAAIHWQQNPRYNVENRGQRFMDNYGWSSLGLTSSPSIAFGIMLLGPRVEYPPTTYESEGLFLVIGGSPEWKSGEKPWTRVGPGSIIGRPFGGSEGKRTGDEPMLALYAWLYR